MADEELKKLLGEDPDPTPPAEEPAKVAPEENQEAKAKAEQLENLNKAIGEAQSELKRIRKDKQKAKTETLEDEELPKINDEDPSVKAWNRRIQSNVAPMQAELEKEKDEIRTFALKEFLKDRPSLAKNPEKLKAVMETYDRIKTSSERTREGVMLDLDKAYAAEYHEELISSARGARLESNRNDELFSDIAVSRGSTAYSDPKEETPNLSDDDKAIIAKWGYTPAEWAADKKKYG